MVIQSTTAATSPVNRIYGESINLATTGDQVIAGGAVTYAVDYIEDTGSNESFFGYASKVKSTNEISLIRNDGSLLARGSYIHLMSNVKTFVLKEGMQAFSSDSSSKKELYSITLSSGVWIMSRVAEYHGFGSGSTCGCNEPNSVYVYQFGGTSGSQFEIFRIDVTNYMNTFYRIGITGFGGGSIKMMRYSSNLVSVLGNFGFVALFY